MPVKDPKPARPPARCGTYAGYQAHRRTKTTICDPCRQARSEYVQRQRQGATTTRTPEAVAAILDDYCKGIRIKDIAARHGLSAESIRSLARGAGIGKRDWPLGYCSACLNRMKLNPEGMCANCALDVPLEGGAWVPRGGIVVWVEDVVA